MLTDCRNCCEEGLYCIPFLICCMCTVMVTMPDEYITITIITCICTHAWRDSVQLDAVCVVSQSSRYAMVTTVSIVIVACIWIWSKLYGLLWCQANKALWSRVLIISSITILSIWVTMVQYPMLWWILDADPGEIWSFVYVNWIYYKGMSIRRTRMVRDALWFIKDNCSTEYKWICRVWV